MTEAYPLHWPSGYKRTEKPKKSQFKRSFSEARDKVMDEIRKFGGKMPILSTEIPLRKDGIPYANYGKLSDEGVAVYFTYNSQQVVFCCDKWDSVADNMNAIGLTLEALRGMERWGVSDMISRTFSGFKALPEGTSSEWNVVLGVTKDAHPSVVKDAYKKLAMKNHPDMGGSHEEFLRIQKAWDEFQKL